MSDTPNTENAPAENAAPTTETPDPMAALKAAKESAEKDAADLKDRLLRMAAEFENYKKRVAQQSSDDVDRATGKIAEALLPVPFVVERARIAACRSPCSVRLFKST